VRLDARTSRVSQAAVRNSSMQEKLDRVETVAAAGEGTAKVMEAGTATAAEAEAAAFAEAEAMAEAEAGAGAGAKSTTAAVSTAEAEGGAEDWAWTVTTPERISLDGVASMVARSRRWARGAKGAVAVVQRVKWKLTFPDADMSALQSDPELAGAFQGQLLHAVGLCQLKPMLKLLDTHVETSDTCVDTSSPPC